MARLDAELLRSLATHRAARPSAISCYLDLDPASVPTASELATHVTSIVAETRRLVEDGAAARDHETATHLRADVERIASFLEAGLDRSGAHGLALFVSGGHDRWTEIRLPGPVEDAAYVGRTFLTSPLLEFAERDREVILAAVGRDRGTLWRLRNGQATGVAELSRDGQGQHDQGGWSQARYQRAREEEAREHMQEVADAIAARLPQGSDRLLLVACADEQRSTFEALLEPHVRDAVIGFAEVEKQDDAQALVPEAERLLDAHLECERRSLLQHWQEEVGQLSGRATGSWGETLRAAWDGRVDYVLVDGRSPRAYDSQGAAALLRYAIVPA